MKKQVIALLVMSAIGSTLAGCGGDATPTPAAIAPTATVAGQGQGTATATTGTGTGGAKRKVVVGSKDFTEEFLLAEMYAQVLENEGVPVERKINLGGAEIAHAAMVRGGAQNGIDMYPEYTSTGLTVILKRDPIFDPPQVYSVVKQGYAEQFKMTWLDASPMNDTQAMVTTKDVSDKLGIKSLADLCAKSDQVSAAIVAEFKERPDALPRLQQTYTGCQNWKELKVMDASLRYPALLRGDVDIAQAFSTDGQIAGNNLVLLEDPKNYGLPYNVAPVVRDDVLAMYPNIAPALNRLSAKITNEVISGLNWEVDGKQREYSDVAKEWLKKEGLVK